MATRALSAIFVPFSTVGIGTIVDIDPTLTGTIDIFSIRGVTDIIGGLQPSIGIGAEDTCFFATSSDPTSVPLPTTADPPFPPVWPYPFSTGEIYGRDHLSVNLKLVRGDTYSFQIAVILNGSPVDLSGGTLKLTAKWDVRDTEANAVFTLLSPSLGIVVTSATGGLATLTISPSQTIGLPDHQVNLPYDIQLTDFQGNIFTVMLGILSIVPDITTA